MTRSIKIRPVGANRIAIIVGAGFSAAAGWPVAGYSQPPADVALGKLLRVAAGAGQVSRIRIWNRTVRTRPR